MTFRLPPYPYDRLAGLAKLADAHPGGMVDCSIGTPCDPPPPAVVDALASSGTERGYPASAGSPQLREAAAAWLARRFGLGDVPPVGLRRRLRRDQGAGRLGAARAPAAPPGEGHGAVPRGVVSDLRHGRRAGRVPRRRRPAAAGSARAASTSSAIDAADAARALVLWSNSPSNPTGGLGDLGAEAAWGRAHGVPVFSDECYAEFTWDGPPRSVLQHGADGVVAVHSLSKRSNLAGVRVGFYAGDAELVEFLRAVRQHAGLMVPGPAQAAGVAALADDEHVELQRARYRERLAFLAERPRRLRLPGRPSRGRLLPLGPGPRRTAGPTPGRWPRRWPPTAACWSARATSTATTVRVARAGGRGPADGAVGAGGGAPR